VRFSFAKMFIEKMANVKEKIELYIKLINVEDKLKRKL